MVGRFSGEEFALVLPEVDEADARIQAERLRRAVEAARYRPATGEAPISATMSMGIACFPQDGRTITELTHAGDIALYSAKEAGRNRVACASETAPAERQMDETVESTPTPLPELPVEEVERETPAHSPMWARGGAITPGP